MLRPLWPRRWIVVAALCFAASLSLAGTAAAQPALDLQLVASGFVRPLGIVNARDGSNRLFIVEQGGTIKIYNGTQVLATPFLDIASKVFVNNSERGLLGLAFDPSYASNGFFYVYYTSQPAGAVTIARYSVTADPNVANPNSELILKTQAHADFANHNGGSLVFGPDGCLYAGIGDGGSGGDPNGNGQNLNTLLAKIIRINPTDGAACTAAPGNPFVGQANVRDEIWALGVRNPWRITFDRLTGDMLIADVGQDVEEELNIQPPGIGGRNYCWRHKEGLLIFDAGTACTAGIPTDPVLVYDHTNGRCSITGGYRYRGSRIPELNGTYFYGDFCTGEVWGATASGNVWSSTRLFDTTFNISTFGEDESGDIYLADITGGALYKLVDTRSVTTTSLGSSPNPSVYGQSVTFTATVTGSGVSGTVTFKDGATTLGSGTLSSATAAFSTSLLTIGSHQITAVYGGDATFAGSTSAPLTQTVNVGGAGPAQQISKHRRRL
jgi:glucose/arabinose dehydrogenase